MDILTTAYQQCEKKYWQKQKDLRLSWPLIALLTNTFMLPNRNFYLSAKC